MEPGGRIARIVTRREMRFGDPGASLADAWQRVDWANRDGETFRDVCATLVDSAAFEISARFTGDRWEAVFDPCIDSTVQAERVSELARLLGSFLDHARAALNYTAFELALQAIREHPALNDPAVPREQWLNPNPVEFPIFMSRSLYRRKNHIKRFPVEYADPIEAVQPYNGGHDGLWMLHSLGGEFRHHVIHPTIIWPVHPGYRVLVNGIPFPASDVEIIRRERLHPGDVILRFTLANVGPDASVDPQVVLAVGIDHPACEGLEAASIVNRIVTEVGDVIGSLENQFLT